MGNPLGVQWLGLYASTAGVTSSISGWKIPTCCVVRPKKNKKQKQKQKEGRKNCQINWLASECETYSDFRGNEIWKISTFLKKLHFTLASMKCSDSFLLLICGFMLLDFSVSGVLEGAVTTPWLSTSAGKSPLTLYPLRSPCTGAASPGLTLGGSRALSSWPVMRLLNSMCFHHLIDWKSRLIYVPTVMFERAVCLTMNVRQSNRIKGIPRWLSGKESAC